MLQLSEHQHLEVRSASAEALEVVGTWLPGGRNPPAHLHPEQDEAFEVHAGRLAAKVGGEEREYGPGERFDVPRGTTHAMWHVGEEPAVATWRVTPALGTLEMFEEMDALVRDGRTGVLDLAAVIERHPREFRLAGPGWATKAAVKLLAAAGGRRRYTS